MCRGTSFAGVWISYRVSCFSAGVRGFCVTVVDTIPTSRGRDYHQSAAVVWSSGFLLSERAVASSQVTVTPPKAHLRAGVVFRVAVFCHGGQLHRGCVSVAFCVPCRGFRRLSGGCVLALAVVDPIPTSRGVITSGAPPLRGCAGFLFCRNVQSRHRRSRCHPPGRASCMVHWPPRPRCCGAVLDCIRTVFLL